MNEIELWEQEIEKNPYTFQRLDNKINFLSEAISMDYKYCEMFGIHEGVILTILEKLGELIKGAIEWVVGLFQKIADFFGGSRQENTINRIDATTKVATEKLDKSSEDIKKEYEDDMKRKEELSKEDEKYEKFNGKMKNLIHEFNRKQFDFEDEKYFYFIKDKNKLDEKIVGIYENDKNKFEKALSYYVMGDKSGNQSYEEFRSTITTDNTIKALSKQSGYGNDKYGIFLGLYNNSLLDKKIFNPYILPGEGKYIFKNFSKSLKECYTMSCNSAKMIKDIVEHAKKLYEDYQKLYKKMEKVINSNNETTDSSSKRKGQYVGGTWFSDACHNIIDSIKQIKYDLTNISGYFISQNVLFENISRIYSVTFGMEDVLKV